MNDTEMRRRLDAWAAHVSTDAPAQLQAFWRNLATATPAEQEQVYTWLRRLHAPDEEGRRLPNLGAITALEILWRVLAFCGDARRWP